MEGDITHSNHNFGPETINHPLLFKVGGPCSLEGELSPPPPDLFSHSSLSSWLLSGAPVSGNGAVGAGPQLRN